MSKSCNCIWAEDDGTCCLDQDPPIEATCPHWRDRVDPVTGESLGPIHPAPEREKIAWKGKPPWICKLYGGYTVNCRMCYVHICGYYDSLEEGLRQVCPNLKGKRPELVDYLLTKGS